MANPIVTSDFLTASLGWSYARNGAVINATTKSVNLDGSSVSTGQAITNTFTVPAMPPYSDNDGTANDGTTWDTITFTYDWSSTNATVNATQVDRAEVHIRLLTENSAFPNYTEVQVLGPRVLVSEANATVGTVSGTATATFTDIAPGTYRLFFGEGGAEDGEALRFTVKSGQAKEELACFVRGTMIETVNGTVPVQSLKVGDLVMTRQHGAQAIRWIGSTKLDRVDLAAAPKLRPIRICAGALGKGLPSAELLVSQQHRILVRSPIVQRMFGAFEVLVAAKHLIEVEGISIADDITEAEYYHILFDQHEIILSNGAETESLYTGTQALKSVGQAARDEIFALFPELLNEDHVTEPAANLIKGKEGRLLAWRHVKNRKPLVRN